MVAQDERRRRRTLAKPSTKPSKPKIAEFRRTAFSVPSGLDGPGRTCLTITG